MDFLKYDDKIWCSFKFGANRYALCEDGSLYSYYKKRLLKRIPPNPEINVYFETYSLWDGKKAHIYGVFRLLSLMFYKKVKSNKTVATPWDTNYKNTQAYNVKVLSKGEVIRKGRIKEESHIKAYYFGSKGMRKLYYRFMIKHNNNRIQKYFKTLEEAKLYRDNFIATHYKKLFT